jgi:hypothetical protein
VRRVPCDAQYIEALGYAVYNFATLEFNVAYIIERLEPGYLQEYISNEKTAGDVAKDLAQAKQRAEAQGHTAAAELRDIYNAFVDLKNRRNKLLHANPTTAPSGAQQLHYLALSIAWDLDAVHQSATDFAAAAEKANSLLYGVLRA